MGDPIGHSLSPLLHNAAFDALGLDWVSVAFEVPAGQAAVALAGAVALGLAGLSVTMPHKQQAAAAVDERSAVAEHLGAVNCVTIAHGRLHGDSTDGAGFLAALSRQHGFDPSGRSCLVVGAGGAARAVILALSGAGAGEVVVVNRHHGRAAEAAALAGGRGRVGTVDDVAGVDLVVQATPVGMVGASPEAEVLPGARFHGAQVVIDIVYRPSTTALLERAAATGARVGNGLGMLVHQAALAVEHWTGLEVPVEAMWSAAGAASGPGALGPPPGPR